MDPVALEAAVKAQHDLRRHRRAWGIVVHLHAVNDVPAWREAYNEMLPEVSRFYAELGQNLKLFEKYKLLRSSPEFATLSGERDLAKIASAITISKFQAPEYSADCTPPQIDAGVALPDAGSVKAFDAGFEAKAGDVTIMIGMISPTAR